VAGARGWLAMVSRPVTGDVVMAAAVAAVTAVLGGLFGAHHGHPPGAVGFLLAVVAGGALAWWRDRPTAVLLVVFCCHLGTAALVAGGGPVYLPLIVAFGGCVLRGDRRVAYGVLGAGYGVAVAANWPPTATFALALAAWFLVLASAAEITRVTAQARRAQAARRRDEERLRIAADLHDVLAHELALITVQANAGIAMLHRDPDRTGAALRAIKTAGNSALAELRFVLESLRTDAPRRPTPLLSREADLARLVDGAVRAGLAVDVETVGPQRPLPVPVDLTAYRIVQEALTNAVRHAGPGTAVTLRVEHRADALAVTVTDDGAGTAASQPGGGNGLPGMRERVTALGGSLRAEPLPGNGFRVAAELPATQPRPRPATRPTDRPADNTAG
jgi:signal transduction histidine kinase